MPGPVADHEPGEVGEPEPAVDGLRGLGEGDRVYSVEGRFVRGSATVAAVTQDPGTTCGPTGREFEPGWCAVVDARSWRWVEPIYVGAGFRGWQYADGYLDVAGGVEVVGGWRDPQPGAPALRAPRR